MPLALHIQSLNPHTTSEDSPRKYLMYNKPETFAISIHGVIHPKLIKNLQRALTVPVGIATLPLPVKMFTAAAMDLAGVHFSRSHAL